MYCKNCGKLLPDDARFCDKCNMSVRKKEGKMDMIEELKEERLARKKAYEIEERLKKIKKVKRKRYRGVVFLVIGVIAVWVCIVGFSFRNNYINSTLRDAEPELRETRSPEPTADTGTDIADDGYVFAAIDGINLKYPDIFTQSEIEDADCVASFSDSDGTAKLVIDRKAATRMPRDLMDEYVMSVMNADPDKDRTTATDSGYTITLTSGTKMHHKKCVIRNGEAISYELIYPKASESEFAEYADYMDRYFTAS